ncbi:MAG: AAA family ATPase [Solirubrobacteraceae bacterium]
MTERFGPAVVGSVDATEPRAIRGLAGRRGELELIRAFLDRVRADGGALLLFGEPGVGKTALLDAAGELASVAATRTLRAGGVEFEADVPYSGLHQLLLPLQDEFAALDPGERQALNVALGFGLGPAPDRLAMSNATLSLLRRATARAPLLMIVDDLPWLDRATAVVLGFVARRLAGTRVGFCAAARSGSESFFERTGLPELELGPLDEQAASNLIAAHFPALAPVVRERLLAEARGNPLALLELPATLTNAQRAAFQALPTALPLSRRLRTLFASRITELPGRTRQLLLLMALDGTGDARVLEGTAPSDPGMEDLALAERARLAYLAESTHRLMFRHPLIRSAVVELATSQERRRAHQQLAQIWTDQGDRRAWHLGHATVEPDEEVAGLLEQAAHHILRRGDGIGAVSALTRAADLSPRGTDRGRRLAEAAYIGADITGQLRSASQLLADAHRADPEFTASLQAAATAAFVLINGDGDVGTAHRLLVGAIASAQRVSDTALEEALNTLSLVCFFSGRAESWAPFYDGLTRLKSKVPRTLELISTCFADPLRTGAAARPLLDQAISDLASEEDPTVILKVGFAAGNVERLSECRHAFWRVLRAARDAGAVGSAIQALVLIAFEDFWTGQWAEATRLAEEARTLCEAHGFPLFAFSVRHVQAAVAAAQGQDAEAQALVDAMNEWAIPRGVRLANPITGHIKVLIAAGRGDFEEVYRLTSSITPPGTLPSHLHVGHWIMTDLVEATIRTHRTTEASAHVAAIRNANLAAISPRLRLLSSAAWAIGAADECAVELFDEALATPEADHWPFDLARVELAYGERLRRLRATTASRIHLTAAVETFDRLGAHPWANRAATELRATGQTKPRRIGLPRDDLTSQECEIAMLAATGLSNKEIGQRLFLSHRTVAAHLHRAFPKLGITSRAGLRDALDSLTEQ